MISRRNFGQAVGMAAVASTVRTLSAEAGSPQSRDRGRPKDGVPDELCDQSAVELVARMRRKELSGREVMAAHLTRIERVWGRQPGEIFYQKDTSLMTLTVRGASLEPAAPREVLGGLLPPTLDDMVAPWDVALGGRGFVMPRQLDQKQASTLMVALHWTPGVTHGSPSR